MLLNFFLFSTFVPWSKFLMETDPFSESSHRVCLPPPAQLGAAFEGQDSAHKCNSISFPSEFQEMEWVCAIPFLLFRNIPYFTFHSALSAAPGKGNYYLKSKESTCLASLIFNTQKNQGINQMIVYSLLLLPYMLQEICRRDSPAEKAWLAPSLQPRFFLLPC